VSVGQPRSCSGGYGGDYYFKCDSDDVVVYQLSFLSSTTTSLTTKSYTYKETVKPGKHAAFNFTSSNAYAMSKLEFSYHYKLSKPGHVLLLSSSDYSNLVSGSILSKPYKEDRFVTEVSYTISGYNTQYSSTIYLVVVNPNGEEITVKEDGYISAYMTQPPSDVKTCSRECIISGSSKGVLLVNKGTNRTIPVTMLKNYGLSADMLSIIIPFCTIGGMFLIALLALSLSCCCASDAPKTTTDSTTKVDQNATPMETMGQTPGAAPAPVAYAGAGPESTPPPVYAAGTVPPQDTYAANPYTATPVDPYAATTVAPANPYAATAPADPYAGTAPAGTVPTSPTAVDPYAGQTDIYGIPLQQ